MNTINLTPSAFVNSVLEANELSNFVIPTLFNLTQDKFVIVDTTFRERFVKGAKIDLSFLNELDIDVSYLMGELTEDVVLEDVELGAVMGDSVVSGFDMPMLPEDPKECSFELLRWATGVEVLDQSSVSISSLDGVTMVEINNSPYFIGTLNIKC